MLVATDGIPPGVVPSAANVTTRAFPHLLRLPGRVFCHRHAVRDAAYYSAARQLCCGRITLLRG